MRPVYHLIFAVIFFGFIAACSVAPTIEQPEPTSNSISPEVSTPSISPVVPTPSEDYDHLGLTEAEVTTLLSLEQVDEYPLYAMDFYGDYDIAAQDIEQQTKIEPFAASWSCSLFAALGESKNKLYGRNFDWDYSPALLLFTHPLNGYASVSVVDIAYLGYEGTDALGLTEAPMEDLVSLLDAPRLPFDGMNEKGLAVGMAAVPAGDVPADPEKDWVDSLEIIRLMLDHAATVNEALEILQNYNIDFGGGPPIHYLVADAQGDAALFEHFGGEIHVLRNQTAWFQATNFLVSSVASPSGQCRRYDTIGEQLDAAQGALTPQAAMGLLQDVSQTGTQWSVVYSISAGEIHIGMGRDYDEIHVLNLDLTD